MIKREDLIAIGVFKKPHGIEGEISASIDCDYGTIKRFSCLISNIDGVHVPFFIQSARFKSAESVLLNIDGIDNETEASLLVNKEILVLKKEYRELMDAEELDEYPLDYFIGFHIKDHQVEVGEIIDIEDSTANVLFVVEQQGRKLLIPAVEDFIEDFDLENRIINMAIPQELLEL